MDNHNTMRATGVIIQNGKILLIHRFSHGKEYYVLPGGGVEENENIEAAAIREIKEETNLDARIDRRLWEYANDFDKRTHHFFLVTKFTGDLKLSGPESERNCESDRYILEWHDIKQLGDLLLYPEPIKKKIMEELSKYGE